MNLELSADQEALREAFARFLNDESNMARVRAALPSGFDRALWEGLAELGAFAVRVPVSSGGLGLGILDATVLLEEVGRTLASGPIVESMLAARLLAVTGGRRDRRCARRRRHRAGDGSAKQSLGRSQSRLDTDC